MDETGHISNRPHCNNGEIRMEKGKRKWVRIIIYVHVYSGCYLSKKGGETSKSKIQKGLPTCIKGIEDKIGTPDGWVQ